MPKVLLGVCGGIAAYKSAEIARELMRGGAEVRVAMTAAAREFVGKITFEALTGKPVMTDLFGDGAFGTSHIEAARWADLLLIAPATANTMARMAGGFGDDSVSVLYLAFRGPVLIAPAMNTAMWEHAAVRANVSALRDRNVRVMEPEVGEMACGETGPGKMPEPKAVVLEAFAALRPAGTSLAGLRVVVTAGPTREYIDPVRFISSPSTGAMGVALAREAARRGAAVTLIHGPVAVPALPGVRTVGVTTALEMAEAAEAHTPCDVFVAAAAVGDFRAKTRSDGKIKRQGPTITLELAANPDIVGDVARRKRAGVVVGFAAETGDLAANAGRKLEDKGLDLIAGNLVDIAGRGFGEGRTSLYVLDRSGATTAIEASDKASASEKLWDRIEAYRRERR